MKFDIDDIILIFAIAITVVAFAFAMYIFGVVTCLTIITGNVL